VGKGVLTRGVSADPGLDLTPGATPGAGLDGYSSEAPVGRRAAERVTILLLVRGALALKLTEC
jgi:hypothetical protein